MDWFVVVLCGAVVVVLVNAAALGLLWLRFRGERRLESTLHQIGWSQALFAEDAATREQV